MNKKWDYFFFMTETTVSIYYKHFINSDTYEKKHSGS